MSKGQELRPLTIVGVESLHGADHNVVQDRIEAGTFMIGAAMTGGRCLDRRCHLGTQPSASV